MGEIMGDTLKEKKTKKVTFADDVVEKGVGKAIVYSEVAKVRSPRTTINGVKVLSFLKQRNLDGLCSYLENFIPEEVNRLFCSEKGQMIVGYLLSKIMNDEIYFLLRKTPVDCLKNAIRQDNYAPVRDFLSKHELAERYNADSEKVRAARIEKFKVLLEIDEELKSFMDAAGGRREAYITPKIMYDFRQAIALNLKSKFII